MESKNHGGASDPFIRARSPEQKALRREEIKAVAAQLFTEVSYHEITLTTIADRLKWSRANLYKYVTTKEEIYLELYLDLYREYMKALYSAFFTADGKFRVRYLSDLERAGKKAARVSKKHALALRLYGLLPAIIESNVRYESLLEFKRAYLHIDDSLIEVFARLCPHADAAELDIMMHSYMLEAAGMTALIECGELTMKAMKEAGVPFYLKDFDAILTHFFVMQVQYNNWRHAETNDGTRKE